MKQTDTVRRLVGKVSRRSPESDGGYTLPEVLVASIIFTIMAALVTGFVIMQMRAGASSSSRAAQQAGTVDALDRVSQEISIAAPLVKASPTEIFTKTSKPNDTCVLNRYVYAAGADSTGKISQQVSDTLTAAQCAAPLSFNWNPITPRVIIDRVKAPAAGQDIFMFYGRDGQRLTVPAAGWTFDGPETANTGLIARVDVVVGSKTGDDRNGGREPGSIALGTSIAIRSAAAGQLAGEGGSTLPQGVICPVVRTVGNTLYFGSVNTGVSYKVTWVSGNANQSRIIAAAPVGQDANPPAGYVDTVSYPATGGREYSMAVQPNISYSVNVITASGVTTQGCLPVQVTQRADVPQVGIDVGPQEGTAKPRNSVPWTTPTQRPTVYVTWPAANNATGYNVYLDNVLVQKIAQNDNQPNFAFGTPTTPARYTIPNADWGREYKICVTAFSATGGEGLQNCNSVVTYPDNVEQAQSRTQASGTNTVTWAAPQRDASRTQEDTVAVTSYQIWRSVLDTKSSGTKTTGAAGTQKSVLVATVPSNVFAWTDDRVADAYDATGVNPGDITPELGSRYQYTVVALNATGNGQDALATATGAGAWSGWTLQYPAAPVVNAYPSNYGTNTLTWPAVKSATSYTVYRSSEGANSGYTEWATVDANNEPGDRLTSANGGNNLVTGNANNVTWNDGAALGSTYYYYVVANNDAGRSAQSNQPSVLQYPPAPTLTATPTDYARNTVEWTTTKSSRAYNVYRSADGSTTSWSLFATCTVSSVAGVNNPDYVMLRSQGVQMSNPSACVAGSTAGTYKLLDSSAAEGSKYSYKVVAYNATGKSYDSNAPTVVQFPAVPAMVTPGSWPCGGVTTASCNLGTTANVVWRTSAGADTYEVFGTSTGSTATVSSIARTGGNTVNTTTRSYPVKDQGYATQRIYATVAWNSTGPSRNYRAAIGSTPAVLKNGNKSTLDAIVKGTVSSPASNSAASVITIQPSAPTAETVKTPTYRYDTVYTPAGCTTDPRATKNKCTGSYQNKVWTGTDVTFKWTGGAQDVNSGSQGNAKFCGARPWTDYNYTTWVKGCTFLVSASDGGNAWMTGNSWSGHYSTDRVIPSYTVTSWNPGGVSGTNGGGPVVVPVTQYKLPEMSFDEGGYSRVVTCAPTTSTAIKTQTEPWFASTCPAGWSNPGGVANPAGDFAWTGYKITPNTTNGANNIVVTRNYPANYTKTYDGNGTFNNLVKDYNGTGSNRTYTYTVTVSGPDGPSVSGTYTVRTRPSTPNRFGSSYMAKSPESDAHGGAGRWRQLLNYDLNAFDAGEDNGANVSPIVREDWFLANAGFNPPGDQYFGAVPENQYTIFNGGRNYAYDWRVGRVLSGRDAGNVWNEGFDYFAWSESKRPTNGVNGWVRSDTLRIGQTRTSGNRNDLSLNPQCTPTSPNFGGWCFPSNGATSKWAVTVP